MLYDPQWETKIKSEPWRKGLLDAAAIIRHNGHTKYMLRDTKGYCALGAIGQAILGDYTAVCRYDLIEENPAFRVAIDRFAAHVGSPLDTPWSTSTICSWNNEDKRTKSDVIAALEACARA
jgi:hypothetical protein